MNLQEVYLEAKKDNFPSLCLLIEFLVMEKKVLTFADPYSELQLYFNPNNKLRMNKLLIQYKESEINKVMKYNYKGGCKLSE